ncbi:phosphoribosyltransferase [Modestobacter versicolor]|uniref:phosphoribosyltransferase n=1 Tax=Modestobacter versicolor TaxID=429133 RepID=UPI0034DF1CB7
MTGPWFTDRADAGRQLAGRLAHLRGPAVLVLGLPRGGVPVAAEVAAVLGAPLDVVVVRKLGVPGQPELAMGAVGEDGVLVVNGAVLTAAGVDRGQLSAVAARERTEVDQRAWRFRPGRPRQPVLGRTAVVVDDGIATGATARAACQVVRAQGAARVVLAVPVCAPGAVPLLAAEVEELVVVEIPDRFRAVGQAYADFRQVGDEEVVALLR